MYFSVEPRMVKTGFCVRVYNVVVSLLLVCSQNGLWLAGRIHVAIMGCMVQPYYCGRDVGFRSLYRCSLGGLLTGVSSGPVHIKCGLGGLCILWPCSQGWPQWPVHIKCGLGGLFTLSVASAACSH